MKAREFGHLLGFRSKPRSYGFESSVIGPVRNARIDYSDSGFRYGGSHEGIGRWRYVRAFKLRGTGQNLESNLKNQCSQLLAGLSFSKVNSEGDDIRIHSTLSSVTTGSRPFFKAEVYKHTNPGQREELYSFFAEHQYVIHRTENDGCFRGQVLRESDLMNWRHFDIFCTPKASLERSRVS